MVPTRCRPAAAGPLRSLQRRARIGIRPPFWADLRPRPAIGNGRLIPPLAGHFHEQNSQPPEPHRSRQSSDLLLEAVLDVTEAADLATDDIALLQELARVHGRADSAGRAGKDEIARFQGHGLRQVLDLLEDVENETAGVRGLAQFAVHAAAYVEVMDVSDGVGRGDPGTDRGV